MFDHWPGASYVLTQVMKDATLGGYLREHERPPGFEGCDGELYTVELLTDPLEGANEVRWGAYLFFLCWRDKSPAGHIESDYLATCDTESKAREVVEKLTLQEIKSMLDHLTRK